MKFFDYIKVNYWRFTPDTWVNWYYHHKYNLKDKFYYWRHYKSKPWHGNIRCCVCAGYGGKSKYDSYFECEDCKGKGFVPRWEYTETFWSKAFKLIGLRFNNKIKKI